MKKVIIKKSNGFTLIELMLTLAIAVILLTVAVPSFQQSIRNNRTTTQANEVFTAFSMARMKAIEQGETVTVCSSSDQASCSGSTDWKTGWIAFTDEDGDQTRDGTDCGAALTDDCLLRVWGALKSDAVLTGSASFIELIADGRANAALTITLKASSSCGTNEQRTISVASTGRASVVKEDCP